MSDCRSREEGYYDGGFGELANPLQCPQLRKKRRSPTLPSASSVPRPVQEWVTTAVEKQASAPPVEAVSPLIAPVEDMVVVLKKITIGAMLSHSEASEEFRGDASELQPCSVSSCSCKQRVIMPTSKSIDGAFVHHNTLSRNHVESLECLLAFLQSPNASAAEGHWVSLFLQVLDNQKRDGASLQDSHVLDASKILGDSAHDNSLQEITGNRKPETGNRLPDTGSDRAPVGPDRFRPDWTGPDRFRLDRAGPVKGNAVLQESLERRKEALHEHRLALERDESQL
ncbi:TELO2 interacting protein 1 [Musa troglodytarum]|uniref:TELO2 interacting protein 1 n=1 Tax=Musa troglodytarum TaxID=320322 RepID=A0A9E7GHH7_9LILI|nr:TELO2 interacting protein 1 [Musa troglodytarum]